MFEAHIKYFSYNNTQGDEFAVGYLDNKEDWIERINRWQSNDGFETRFTAEQFDELEQDDLRGLELAEVEPDEKGGHIVRWADGDKDFSLSINKKRETSWIENNTKNTTVPRWVSRLIKNLK